MLFGVTELVSLDSDRLAMGLTTVVFFLAYGGVLLACALGDAHRAAVVARAGAARPADPARAGLELQGRLDPPVAIGLALVAAIVLAGLLHPRSIDALERARLAPERC